MAQFNKLQPWEYREQNQEFWSQDSDTGVNKFDWAGATGNPPTFNPTGATVNINNAQVDPNLITDPNDPRLNQSHRRPNTPRPRGYAGMMKYLNQDIPQSVQSDQSGLGYSSRDQFLGHIPMDQRGGFNPGQTRKMEAPPVPPQVAFTDTEDFGTNSQINVDPNWNDPQDMAPDRQRHQRAAGVAARDIVRDTPFTNELGFRPQQKDNLMDMAQKVPVGRDLPTDLAGSTQYTKDIIDKGFNKWEDQGRELAKEEGIQNNIAKIISPTQEEQRFINTDQVATPDLRQMAREIDVSNPESVMAFQKAAGMKEDGIFGPKSHAKLREIQGLADDYDKYKNPSLMNYAQNSETMEKKLADFEKNKQPAPWFKGNEWESEQNRRLNEQAGPPPGSGYGSRVGHSNF